MVYSNREKPNGGLSMPKKKPTTVSEYIKAAPKEAQEKLRVIRTLLKKVVPGAKETLKWGSPVFEEGRIIFSLTFPPQARQCSLSKKSWQSSKRARTRSNFHMTNPSPGCSSGRSLLFAQSRCGKAMRAGCIRSRVRLDN